MIDAIRDREALVAALNRGQRAKYVFFWGHSSPKDVVTKACFSQWYPAAFDVDGDRYATSEHWMMAQKARLFDDTAAAAQIIAAKSPGEAKALGRGVKGFDNARWVAARFDIVTQGNIEKFGQNDALREFLDGTGERVLVEASPADRVWGIGLAADDDNASRPQLWNGDNLLGFALMEARARLRARSVG